MVARLTFFLLLLANVLVFAWAQGYFGVADEDHEPLRLEQQLHAEKLRTFVVAPAAAASKDQQACRVVSGLKLGEAEALKTGIEAAGGEVRISPIAEPALYLVVIPDLTSKAAADKKAAELTRLGFEGHSLVTLAEGRYEFILGSFPSEAAAREFLQGLPRRGVKSARIEAREQPALKARAEVRGAAASLLPQLPKLIAPYADATLGECAS